MYGVVNRGNILEILELVEGIVESTADKNGKVLDYIGQAKQIKNDSCAD